MGEGKKLLLNAAAAVVIALAVIRIVFLETIVIRDNGMAPTLVYGEQVWMWKGASIDMANIAVCTHPARPSELVIGRAVAFAGHSISVDRVGTIHVDNDRVTTGIDGSVLFDDRTRNKQFDMVLGAISYMSRHDHQFFIEKNDKLTFPRYQVEHGIYLLGDNRTERTFDSREFGEVDRKRCLGQIVMRVSTVPESTGALGHRAYRLID